MGSGRGDRNQALAPIRAGRGGRASMGSGRGDRNQGAGDALTELLDERFNGVRSW